MQHIRVAAEVRQAQPESPAGPFLVSRARRAAAAALYELSHTIQIYSDLVLRGIVPPDEDALS
jgi:hypothetical protein